MDEDAPDTASEQVPDDVAERPTAEGTTGTRRFGWADAVGLIIIVILAVALILTKVQLGHQDSLNNQRAAAIATARTDATDVATYTYQHMSTDFGRVENEATPSFRRSFIKSSAALSKVLAQYKASASGKILEAGVVSLTSSRAVVILFLNQTVSNTAQKSGTTTDNSRVEVTLDQSGGRWLLQNLKLL